MNELCYAVRTRDGVRVFKESEIIKNALQQERDGIAPHYAFYDPVHGDRLTPAGWLVWSTLESGCGVVYRRHDGKMIISQGVQGDFIYV